MALVSMHICTSGGLPGSVALSLSLATLKIQANNWTRSPGFAFKSYHGNLCGISQAETTRQLVHVQLLFISKAQRIIHVCRWFSWMDLSGLPHSSPRQGQGAKQLPKTLPISSTPVVPQEGQRCAFASLISWLNANAVRRCGALPVFKTTSCLEAWL